MDDRYTEAMLEEEMRRPENAHRTAVRVYQDGDEIFTVWDGDEIRERNPFALDSRLDYRGVPRPRNLFLMADEQL